MIYFSLIVFAILPSLIWLLYYLQKDKKPEPKRFIIYVFFAGMLSAIVAYFFQAETRPLLAGIYYLVFVEKFVLIAFSEELLKYLAVFFTMRQHPELDEPIDFVIYMITAALGFAAVENFIYLYSLGPDFLMEKIALLTTARFIGATFLHALASGILGLFLAYAHRLGSAVIIFYGLLVATVLHGIYNMIIVRMEQSLFIFLLFFFLLSLAAALSVGIKRIRKMKSVCLLK